MSLSDKAREAMHGALVSRGAKKGMLKAKCPPMDTPEAAAWQAMMLCSNPYKVGMGHMLFMGDESRAIYKEVLAWCESVPSIHHVLDRDRKALQSMGVW